MSDYQYPSISAPLLTPAPADAPQTIDRWAPSYPERVHRVTYRSATQSFYAANLLPVPPASTAMDAGAPIIPSGAYELWQYSALAGPLDNPPPPPSDDINWRPLYPSQIDRPTTLAANQRAWAMDQFDAPPPPPAPTESAWTSRYPSLVNRRPEVRYGHPSFWMDPRFTPTPPDESAFGFRPVYPDAILRTTPRHQYVWAQPHFVVQIDVPVMSWTGRYLEPPPRAKQNRALLMSSIAAPTALADTTVPAPESSWQHDLPDQVFRAVPPSRGPWAFGPIYLADVTVSSPLSGSRAVYPDWIAPKRGLASLYQKAWTMDATFTAPVPPTVPDLAAPVYPAFVSRRPPVTPHPSLGWPPHVLDVTNPVTALSWSPEYPDYVWVTVRRPHHNEGYTTDTFPLPTPVFLAAWAQNSNRYFSIPVDVLLGREDDE